MNIKKEMVKTFKNLLGVYFGKVYTADEIKISDKVVGGKVEQVQADGSLTPIPDGDYVMEDGFSFTTKDGVITSIVGEDAPVEDTTDVKAGDTPTEEAAPANSDTTDLEQRLTALEDQVKQILDSMNMEKQSSAQAIEAFTKEVKSLNDNIQELAKVPVEFSKINKNKVVEESREEKLFNVAKLIGGLNSKK
jgi:hypothetical protein